jgi:hypothetical protein
MPRLTQLFAPAIALLLLACLGSVPAFAADDHVRSRLTWDFDGDHKTDLAVGSVEGSTFTINVRFSSGLHRIVLKTNIHGHATPYLLATDVDHDNNVDLVLTGVSSRPLAVWFNEGKGKFKKSSRWFFPPLYRGGAGQIRHAVSKESNDPANTVYSPLFLPVALSIRLNPPDEGRYCAPTLVSFASASCGAIFSRGPPIA